MRKLLLALALLFIPVPAMAADAAVKHSINVRVDFDTVRAVLEKQRFSLLSAAGVRVTKQLGRDRFEVSADRFRFIIKETRTRRAGVVIVVWKLDGGDCLRHYKSVIVLQDLGDKCTRISGSVSLGTAGRLGNQILEQHIQAGVTKMQTRLMNLLNTK